MRRPAAFLRTRVARRVLLAFTLSALLPISILAVVSYRLVTDQLYRQAQERLHDASRAIGQGIHERLAFLDARLADMGNDGRLVPRFAGAGRVLEDQFLQGRLLGLTAVIGRGERVDLFGSAGELPTLSEAQRSHLKGGRSLLVTDGPRGARVIRLGRLGGTPGTATLYWASLDPEYLWAGGYPDAVAGDRQVCIVDDQDFVLDCAAPLDSASRAQLRSQVSGQHAGAVEWTAGGREYIGAFWSASMHLYRPAPLQPGSGPVPAWRVIVSESRESVLTPVARFRRSFPLIALLAVWVALLMSNVQIRRSMEPLNELSDGTDRVARRDFTRPVLVTSGDEFEGLANSFNTMAARLDAQFHFLTAMNEIDRAVLSTLDRDVIVRAALLGGLKFLEADAMGVAIASSEAGRTVWSVTTVPEAVTGRRMRMARAVEELDHLRARPGGMVAHGAAELPSVLRVPPLDDPSFQVHLVLPILLRDQVGGVIAVAYRRVPGQLEEQLGQARQISDQVAVALSNARLVEQLDSLRRGALTALARTIDAKSPWTAGHSERVTAVSLAIGRRLGLTADHLDLIYRGGLLHDIGKIGVPAEVLDKSGLLTPAEFALMRAHVEIGARILAPIEAHADIIPIVLYHHERLDGSGYPNRLVGEAIPFEARLVAVADVYDAVNSPRPYRKAWGVEGALAHIRQLSGIQFDPGIVEPLLDLAASGELPDTGDGGSGEVVTEAAAHGGGL